MSREDLKWDKGKLNYCLILAGFLKGMAEVLTKGEVNHPKVDGQPSWQLVEPEAYEKALFRHWQDYREDNYALDKDMGTHHMLHIAVNAMFLWWFRVTSAKPIEELIMKAPEYRYLCPVCNAHPVQYEGKVCNGCREKMVI